MDAMVALARGVFTAGGGGEERSKASARLRDELIRLLTAPEGDGFNALALLEEARKQDVVQEVVRAVLESVRPSETAGEAVSIAGTELRRMTSSAMLELLAVNGFGDASAPAERVFDVLVEELDGLPPEALAELSSLCLDTFQSDAQLRHLALLPLPKALQLLQRDLERAGPGECERVLEAPFGQYCSDCLRTACNANWPARHAAQVVAILQDVPSDLDSASGVCDKALTVARSAGLQDLPAMAHQLFSLVRRMPGLMEVGLAGVVDLFNWVERKHSTSALQQQGAQGGGGGGADVGSGGGGVGPAAQQLVEVEGTVLMSVELVAKMSPDFGRAWLRCFKSGQAVLSPFLLAVLLTLAAVPSLERPVMDALKTHVLQVYLDSAQLAACRWLPASRSKAPFSSSAAASSAEKQLLGAFLRTVGNSGCGWERLVQQLTSFCLLLLEGHGCTVRQFRSAMDQDASNEVPPAARAACLAAQVLERAFERHPGSRDAIVTACSDHLVGVTDAQALPFVCLLGRMVRGVPELLGDHIEPIKGCLDALLHLPPPSATALLLAAWPLVRARRDVADSALIKLRKALFLKDQGARLLAVHGFLFFIVQELKDGVFSSAAGGESSVGGFSQASSSQVSMSQHHSLSAGAGSGLTLLHETVGILRRCLKHQAGVKAALYRGLQAVIVADPGSLDTVLQVLLPQLYGCYEREPSVLPPIDLDKAVVLTGASTVRLVEPLHELLRCCRALLDSGARPSARATGLPDSLQLDGSEDSLLCGSASGGGAVAGSSGVGSGGGNGSCSTHPSQLMDSCFSSLKERLLECEAENFGMDKATDFCTSSAEGCASCGRVAVLLGCLEVLMEDVVNEAIGASQDAEVAQRTGQQLLALFRLHQRVSDLALGPSDARAAGKAGKAAADGGASQAARCGAKRGRPARDAAVGGGRGSAGCGAVGTTAVGGGGGDGGPAVWQLEARLPALSERCLAQLLRAILDDGLVAARHSTQEAGASNAAGQQYHSQLARDVGFQVFVFSATQRLLASAASNVWADAVQIACGSEDANPELRSVLPPEPSWRAVGGPVVRAVHEVVVAGAPTRPRSTGRQSAAAGRRDPSEQLLLSALRCLDTLLSLPGCRRGLAAVMADAPEPEEGTVDAAEAALLAKIEKEDMEAHCIASRLPLLKQMLAVLVENECWREVEVLCSCIARCTALAGPSVARLTGPWAMAAAEQVSLDINHVGAAKAIVSMALRCAADDTWVCMEIGQEVQNLLGCKTAEAVEEPVKYGVVTHRTVQAVLGVLLEHLTTGLAAVTWAVTGLKRIAATSTGGQGGSSSSLAGQNSRVALETATHVRLEGLVRVLLLLVRSCATGKQCETLAGVIARSYKLLSLVAKAQNAPKGSRQQPLCPRYVSLVTRLVNKELSPSVYDFMFDWQEQSNSRAKENNAKAKEVSTSIKREAALLPRLVFEMEAHEKQLIALGKKSKVNLLLNARRATNRDFKFTVEPRGGHADVAHTPSAAQPLQVQHQVQGGGGVELGDDEQQDGKEEGRGWDQDQEEEEEGSGAGQGEEGEEEEAHEEPGAKRWQQGGSGGEGGDDINMQEQDMEWDEERDE